MNRRTFLGWLNRTALALGGVAFIGPIFAYFFPAKLEETPSEAVTVGEVQTIPVGEAKTIPYGRWPALVIHTEEGLKAYSAVCTHFGCIVMWNAETGEIDCPCHDGFFDPIDGSVIAGPPPAPLEPLPIRTENGIIILGETDA